MEDADQQAPEILNDLRRNMIFLPEEIRAASGITLMGRNIKSLIFSTDVAIIRNNNADAVLSVYPFTPQPAITQALIYASAVPIFCGVGGGITGGERVVDIARDAEFQGASGVVVNQPTANDVILELKKNIHIPIVLTVCSLDQNIPQRLDAGVDIFNVSGAQDTPKIVEKIRAYAPDIPIIASGGIKPKHITATIESGANAITFTPPSAAELMKAIMENHRLGKELD